MQEIIRKFMLLPYQVQLNIIKQCGYIETREEDEGDVSFFTSALVEITTQKKLKLFKTLVLDQVDNDTKN